MVMRYLARILVMFTLTSTAYCTPLMVVLLMIKNEQHVITKTLEHLTDKHILDGNADKEEIAYIIYDTGSQDRTLELTENFFKEHGIKNYHIFQEEFIDFAISRNKALHLARTHYPDSTFILFPDAEWYLHGLDALMRFCKEKVQAYEQGEEPPHYYRLRMACESYISLTPRLMFINNDVEFEGAVHECPTHYSDQDVPTDAYFELGYSEKGAAKSKERWYRDRNLLIKDLEENPLNDRSVLYLGLTEKWLNHNHIAYLYLKKRVSMTVFPEEDFYALYNLAAVTKQLALEDPEHYSWEEAQTYCLQAYAMRPHRAEPLVLLAEHYLAAENFPLCYLFARRACELPLPNAEEEILPVQQDIYRSYRWELLSRAAWYVQDFKLGEHAAKRAIEGSANSPHLYKNLSYYWNKKH